jgi:hypothetical protein
MAMQFDKPVNDEAMAKIVEAFGQPVATDRKTFLFDNMGAIKQRLMTEIANAAKQPATVEVVGEGEIKVMSDGTRYRVTPTGWKKIDE